MSKRYSERVELHCHSVYSDMDGVSSVRDIIEYAMDNKMPAVAITDHASVAGYSEASYLSKLGEGIKMIYGMEAFVVNDLEPSVYGDEKYILGRHTFHVTFLIQNEIGKKNLFDLMTLAEEKYKGYKPRIPWSELEKHREGLLVGTACENGELYLAAMEDESDDVLEGIAEKYDYVEIQPVENKMYCIDEDDLSHEETIEILRNYDRRVISIADKLGKIVVATSDAHFVTKEESLVRAVLENYKRAADPTQQDTYFRTTEEMLEAFSYLGDEKAWEVVVENTNIIAESIDELDFESHMKEHYPRLDDSYLRLKEICYDKLYEIFGDEIPDEYRNQLDWELHSLMESGADSAILLTKELVEESGLSTYEIGYRGCLGGLLTAFLCGITCVDPLDSRFMLYPEFTIGLEGDKYPEISLNFPAKVRNNVWDVCHDLEDIGATYHAGLIGSMSEDEAYKAVDEYEEFYGIRFDGTKREWLVERLSNIRKGHQMNPGAMLLVPEGFEITEFTPLTKLSNGVMATGMSYHDLDNLLWVYVLTNKHINMLSKLVEKTGAKVEDISLNDKEVQKLIGGNCFVSAAGIPELDSEFVREIAHEMGANTFEDLVQLICLSHGTNVWSDNMEELLHEDCFTKDNIIASREDIFECLLALGFTREMAFEIAEFVRKGKARYTSEKWTSYRNAITEAGAPDWFVSSCEKIRYMFPRVHAYIYALHAWWTAWFKINFPMEFFEAYMEVQASDRLKQIIARGEESFSTYMAGYLDAMEDGFCGDNIISKEEFFVAEEMLKYQAES